MMQLVFWSRGLLHWFSSVFAPVELHHSLPGLLAQCKLFRVALCAFCSLKAFCAAFLPFAGLTGSLTVVSFPAPILRTLLTQALCSFCDPRDTEVTLSHLIFCPTLLPEHFSGRDMFHWSKFLKIPILHSRAISLSGSWLTEAPYPHCLYSDISPYVHISFPPMLQIVFSFLFVESQQFLHLRLNSQVFRMIW